jgi:hypothetical protein
MTEEALLAVRRIFWVLRAARRPSPAAGTRLAGRAGESEGVSEFVWGARDAGLVGRESERSTFIASRTSSREPHTQPAYRWSLTLPRPLALAGLRLTPTEEALP